MTQRRTTLNIIDERIEASQEDSRRPHFGVSGCGEECERKLFYSFRWFVKNRHEGRILRLFRRGQDEEAVWIEDLRLAGLQVLDKQGNQYRVSALGGHLKGSLDGLANGVHENPDEWHVLEFKTHNSKSFNHLVKYGLERSKPTHYAQVQGYMHLWPDDIKYALYLAVCKNTDQRYSEIVEYDPYHSGELVDRAERIIFADEPPERLSNSPTFYKCGPKWCEYREICHFGAPPEKSCRSCAYSYPSRDGDGDWVCKRDGRKIGLDLQLRGCEQYKPEGQCLF